jgi:hypothetical protein
VLSPSGFCSSERPDEFPVSSVVDVSNLVGFGAWKVSLGIWVFHGFDRSDPAQGPG